ncbi:MAG: hypothetical protein H6Q52_2073 [Deltaproteobacteria bacterium]|nr:hypothetical protein [Deltaproteobacteria bacterium]
MIEELKRLKMGQNSRLFRGIILVSSIFFSLSSKTAKADSFSVTWGEGSNTAETFLTSLSTMLMNGLLATSFCAGTGLIIWGFISMANRDSNPQGAQGAWKKVAFGGCLVSLSFILGIVKATMKSAAGS